ncbi:MAG: D-alanine--D-alanine ligase [Bacteroidetes bacterium]|nr:D-alanine--D-alanine ligase [Bacteroidota bacterium]
MKKNVAIIAGGDSGEYEISIGSATVVYKNLDNTKYNPYLIIIKGQDWFYLDEDNEKFIIDKADFSLFIDGSKLLFDVIFNVIHGRPGENGIIQGYFDLLEIPYTSSGLTASALTFNKGFCNKIVACTGVLVAKSIHLFNRELPQVQTILEQLKLPLFVKPANGGSSVAISKVLKNTDLLKAIDLAFSEDDEVLVEEFIEGREISCGVINYLGKMMAFPITEIISKTDFFDYEAKYTEGMADEITPADIPTEVEFDCKAISSDLYQKLNCKGVVRFDYIFNDSAIYFLEVNTIPGLSEMSIIPQQAEHMGISTAELFDMMITDALQ